MRRKKNNPNDAIREARNEDPISGEPGAHPFGSGVGAALGGAAVGAVAGGLGGPIGTAAGAIVGGVAGGLVGKAAAENVNPTMVDPVLESEYWLENYRSRPYYLEPLEYDAYEPAYRLGWSSYRDDIAWADQEPLLRRNWEEQRWENEGGQPKLSWNEAKQAAEDAYRRVAEQRGRGEQMDDFARSPSGGQKPK